MKKFYYNKQKELFELISEGKNFSFAPAGGLDTTGSFVAILKKISTGEVVSYPSVVLTQVFTPVFTDLTTVSKEDQLKKTLELTTEFLNVDMKSSNLTIIDKAGENLVENYLNMWYPDTEVHPDFKKELLNLATNMLITIMVAQKAQDDKKNKGEIK